ncbi:hypothetical protein [Pseudomonas fluorescens]|uniref:hypothetical protein n=1 Tax=Pseudomonas fluorescens TaxID=294 RepID=UPI00058A67E8|nr:hypothetical protein [Pseudomonas fluorescens]CEL31174.1 hypothetical protein SRM1_04538 [Pseudomonas fluorescens]
MLKYVKEEIKTNIEHIKEKNWLVPHFLIFSVLAAFLVLIYIPTIIEIETIRAEMIEDSVKKKLNNLTPEEIKSYEEKIKIHQLREVELKKVAAEKEFKGMITGENTFTNNKMCKEDNSDEPPFRMMMLFILLIIGLAITNNREDKNKDE